MALLASCGNLRLARFGVMIWEGGHVNPLRESYYKVNKIEKMKVNISYNMIVVIIQIKLKLELTNLKKAGKTPSGPNIAGQNPNGGGIINHLSSGTAIGNHLLK